MTHFYCCTVYFVISPNPKWNHVDLTYFSKWNSSNMVTFPLNLNRLLHEVLSSEKARLTNIRCVFLMPNKPSKTSEGPVDSPQPISVYRNSLWKPHGYWDLKPDITTNHFPQQLEEVFLKLNVKNRTFIQCKHVHSDAPKVPARWLGTEFLSPGLLVTAKVMLCD